MNFREKTRHSGQAVILYTAVPPPLGTPKAAVEAHIEGLHKLLEDLPIDAINIPEVRDERRGGPRISPFAPKIDPRSFGSLIQKHSMEVLVDRHIVYTNWHNQKGWLLKTWKNYGIRNLVLVGGESSRKRYPGPSVSEAARLIARLKAFFLGGITIPDRQDEPNRLIKKAGSGLEFFISQIIFEPDATKRLLRDYHQCCLEEYVEPKRIFLSFAPISSEYDVKFLKWWGVKIPSEIERFILRDHAKALDRSIQTASRILRDILEFVDQKALHVPLGLNIEHVTRRNLEASCELAACLTETYHGYLPKAN